MTDHPANITSESATSSFKNLRAQLNHHKLKIMVGLIVSVCTYVIMIVLVNFGQETNFVINFGYWILMALFTCFLLFFVRLILRENSLISWCRAHRWAIALALVLTGYLWVNDWHGFKVLFDEHLMGGVAMNMHFDQKAGFEDTVHMVNNTLVGYNMRVDKRPLFFQFLISLAHKFTGYRPENAIFLNTLLTAICLICLYATVTKLTNRSYGIISMLLLAGFPLLAENATGGGFDITNLLLINTLLLVSILFIEKPDATNLNITVAASLLLANTRYESAIYVIVPCLLLLWLWLREDKPKLTWFAVISPVFLILPLVINHIGFADGGTLHMTRGQLFSFHHVGYNLKHACVFLFAPRVMGTNSLLLSGLGVIASISLFVVVITRFRQRNQLPPRFIPLIAIVCCILITVYIALLWGWGEWTDPLASRFSLPLHSIWAVLIPVFFYYFLHYRRPPLVFTVVALVFLFGINYPIKGMNRNDRKFLPAKECAWVLDYLRENNLTENNLFISFATYGLHMYRLPAISPETANLSPSKVFRTTQYGIYKQIYVIQEIRSEYLPNLVNDIWYAPLSQDFILETVAEKQFSTDQSIRISRVVGVNYKGLPEPLQEPPSEPLAYRLFILSLLPKGE